MAGISAVSASQNTSDVLKDVDNVKSVTLNPEKLSTTYDSGKYFKVGAVDTNTKNAEANLDLVLKVFHW